MEPGFWQADFFCDDFWCLDFWPEAGEVLETQLCYTITSEPVFTHQQFTNLAKLTGAVALKHRNLDFSSILAEPALQAAVANMRKLTFQDATAEECMDYTIAGEPIFIHQQLTNFAKLTGAVTLRHRNLDFSSILAEPALQAAVANTRKLTFQNMIVKQCN